MAKYYWTMRNGQQIDVDHMDENHLRNTLKMIMRSKIKSNKPSMALSGDIASQESDKALLYAISPELTCECDEFHICQQCQE